MIKLKTVLIINTFIITWACLAHVPLAILSVMKIKGFEAVYSLGSIALATVDLALLASCIVGFFRADFRLYIITCHAAFIALISISIISMVANVIVFGAGDGNYSFGLGLTTALCTYAVYLGRRIFVEYQGGTVGNYHWYTAIIVGVVEIAMFYRFFGTALSS